jgi:sarcosine oxidase, subunit beta
MNQKPYDVIIIGAGSIGTPAAYCLSKSGQKVLVIDSGASVGQGSNKKAIGGIRATHSDPTKIELCKRSIDIISHWQEQTGDDIEWYAGGYCFVAYRDQEEKTLRSLVDYQSQYGLNVHWLDNKQTLEVVPDFNPNGLIGSSYSPEDGNASPLLTIHSYYVQSLQVGCEYRFNEPVISLLRENNRLIGVRTSQGEYQCRVVINAAGAWARQISEMVEIPLPVTPDSHESAITEPVNRFLKPMIVDIRPSPGSANYYFYQHSTGQLIFCITPNPSIWGDSTQETSEFLPLVARRMVDLMPRLAKIRVRRTWRGLYPMTPDGSPLVGWATEVDGFLQAAGMCGQGFMLGPALGELLTRMVIQSTTLEDQLIIKQLSPYREFKAIEKLK